jgi:trehalose 6-phosphate synthase/phosphatase
MERLRARVTAYDVRRWAAQFESALMVDSAGLRTPADANAPALLRRLQHAPAVTLLLDYDGTLVPLARTPEEAVPDTPLLELLRTVAEHPGFDVHIVSGRTYECLDRYFEHEPVTLWAEHGLLHRCRGASEWQAAASLPTGWMSKVDAILEQFTASTPGAMIERKSVSLSWHYRLADPGFGERQAHELRMLLGDVLSNQPLEVIDGRRVIEIRHRGVTKALAAQSVMNLGRRRGQQEDRTSPEIVAIGDSRSDEDLFAALPSWAVTIGVGPTPVYARFRLESPGAVRHWLACLIERADVV